MNVINGCIPEKLIRVTQSTRTFMRTVDGVDYSIQATPAYFVNKDSKGTSADNWGSNPVVVNNTSFSNLRIWEIEHRGEGGRAWKVIDTDNMMFDIREDVILESIYAGEISNGCLTGDYIWTRQNSHMKVERLNSAKCQAIVNYCEKKAATNVIPMNKLEIGHVYRGSQSTYYDDKMYVYLGKTSIAPKKYCFVKIYTNGYDRQGDKKIKYDTYQQMYDNRFKDVVSYLDSITPKMWPYDGPEIIKYCTTMKFVEDLGTVSSETYNLTSIEALCKKYSRKDSKKD